MRRMIMKRTTIYPVIIFFVMAFVSLTGCSYVMDSVEGAITKRSSFSVDVKRSGNTFTLDWSKDFPSIDEEAFAGYEVYITERPDDEYSGYKILLSGHSANPGDLGYDPALQNSSTRNVTFTYDVSALSGNTYFFRVGVIYWSETDQSERSKNWTTDNGYLYNWSSGGSTVVEYYYKRKSSLEKISGATMVAF